MLRKTSSQKTRYFVSGMRLGFARLPKMVNILVKAKRASTAFCLQIKDSRHSKNREPRCSMIFFFLFSDHVGSKRAYFDVFLVHSE